MKEYKYNSTRGNGLTYIIKKTENKKAWIFEVYFDDKAFLTKSNEYKTLKEAREQIGIYNTEKNILFLK